MGKDKQVTKHREEIPALVRTLMDASDALRPELMEQLLELCGDDHVQDPHCDQYKDFWANVIDGMIDYLVAIKSADQSALFRVLILLSKMPVNTRKRDNPLLQRLWAPTNSFNEENLRLLDQMQLLYFMVKLGAFESAMDICDRNSDQISAKEPLTLLIYGACKANILMYSNKGSECACQWLKLILHFYHTDSADTALFILILWIRAMQWPNDSLTKQRLLSKIYIAVRYRYNVNTALVIYDIFCLHDRLMPPDKKMRSAELLTRRLGGYLTMNQLQELHFFMGNYTSAVRTGFKESIQYFKFSNYYLNKMWSQQIKTSKFFRSLLSKEEYARVIPYFESRILMLGNQVSMYNNAYVESLEADYDQIDALLTQVEELSLTDSLTGLKNRRHLEENIIQILLLATRHNTPISFAIVDIDHFKGVNDKWGHLAGDKVLADLAKIIRDEFRKSDVVIRYGGEEFLIILFDSKLEDTLVKMEVLRAKVEAYVFRYKDHEIKITISIGVNKHDEGIYNHLDVARCIEAADQAVYKAKNEGRNQVRIS
jgi:diguanylate cyclase (GGDEF)-like protein